MDDFRKTLNSASLAERRVALSVMVCECLRVDGGLAQSLLECQDAIIASPSWAANYVYSPCNKFRLDVGRLEFSPPNPSGDERLAAMRYVLRQSVRARKELPPEELVRGEMIGGSMKKGIAQTLKSEVAEVATRTAVASITKSARKPIVAALKNSENPLALQAGLLLETELGHALLALTLGITMQMLPDKFGSAARMEMLGHQLRSQGLQKLAEPLMEALAEPLMEALTKPLALYNQKMDRLEASTRRALPSAEDDDE